MNRARFVTTTAGLWAWSTGVGFAQRPAANRSLWVWQTPLDEAPAVAAFATRYRFGSVFLSIPAADRAALAAGAANALQALGALRNAGLQVYCVAGDPEWVKRRRDEPPETVRRLLGAHQAHGVFDGIALDVEPHTLPEWKDGSDKSALAENYIAVLGLIRAAAAALGLPALATVHPTYAKYSLPSGNGQTLLQSAARAVDATDLMAYRNSEATLESFGGTAMEQLAGVGKPWWLGVSTHANSPPGTSYATLPAARFFAEIDATATELRQRFAGSFAGISVEDYRNTSALLGSST